MLDPQTRQDNLHVQDSAKPVIFRGFLCSFYFTSGRLSSCSSGKKDVQGTLCLDSERRHTPLLWKLPCQCPAPLPLLNKLIRTPKCFAFSYSFSLLLWSSLDCNLASDHGNHCSQSPLDLSEASRMQYLDLTGNRLLTRKEALVIWNKGMD